MLRHLLVCIPKGRLRDLATLSGCGSGGGQHFLLLTPGSREVGLDLEKRHRIINRTLNLLWALFRSYFTQMLTITPLTEEEIGIQTLQVSYGLW